MSTSRTAMLSLYFWAEHQDLRGLPDDMHPMDLTDAAKIVADEAALRGNSTAESRRVRALVHLLAAGDAASPGSGFTDERRTALEILGAPVRLIDAPDFLVPPPDDATRVARERRLYETLDPLGESIDQCKRTPIVTEVTKNANGSRTATYHMTVERPLVELRKVVDPQGWDTCSQLFQSTQIVEEIGGEYEPVSSPPELGDAYGKQLLLEIVQLDWKNGFTRFDTVLDIDAVGSPTTYRVDFELEKALDTTALNGIIPLSPLVIDDGFVQATTDPSGVVKIEGKKTILFSGGLLSATFQNWWAGPALQLLGDETYEAVCCHAS